MAFTKSFYPAFFKNPKLAYLNFSRERMEKSELTVSEKAEKNRRIFQER